MREALITARLQHPSIVPVYDAGSLGDPAEAQSTRMVDLVYGRVADETQKAWVAKLAMPSKLLGVEQEATGPWDRYGQTSREIVARMALLARAPRSPSRPKPRLL